MLQLSNVAEHDQTTSLQLGPDARDHEGGRHTHTHTLPQWDHTPPLSHLLSLPSYSTERRQVYSVSRNITQVFFTVLEKQEFREPQKMKNWLLCDLTGSWRSSPSLSLTQPDIQRNKYWFFQILCVSLVFGWQSRQMDCYSTALSTERNPPSTQRPLSACTPTVLLSPCVWGGGGVSALQSPWELQWGGASWAEQGHTRQCQTNKQIADRVWAGLSEWESEWDIICIFLHTGSVSVLLHPRLCGQYIQFQKGDIIMHICISVSYVHGYIPHLAKKSYFYMLFSASLTFRSNLRLYL